MSIKDNKKTIKTKKNAKLKSSKKILVEKDAMINELNSEVKSLQEKNIKLLAEFDNFQKRSLREKESLRKYQGIDILKDLLPAFDDINRAIGYKEAADESMFEAIELINSKIEKVLTKYSIERIKSMGVNFDPTLHEALIEQESDKIEEGKIMEEYESGYRYHDRIIRHAKVVVSKGKP